MKKQNTTQYLKVLGMVCLGLASMPVRAGDQTFSFDTDPKLDPNFLLAGANKDSAWFATGGNPSGGGYLELTPAAKSQSLCIVFPDVDSGLPVKAFKLTLDARVGNGTTERPADGFSINYCREGDPVLVNATNGVTGGAAGGDDAATCLSATGSGDLENGTKTGVAILFVSSEMEEIMGMSDRVLVMHEGRLSGELARAELSEEAIMRLATGSVAGGVADSAAARAP